MPSVPSNCRFLCGRVECDGLGGCEPNPNYTPECEDTTVCAVCDATTDECECRPCERCTLVRGDYCESCDYCLACCRRYIGCSNCEGCDARIHGSNDYFCTYCDCCEDCCNCVSCEDCGNRVNSEDICNNCNICNSCCDCGYNGMHVSELEATNKFHTPTRKKLLVNKSKRFIAAEIEVARLSSLTYRQDIRNTVKNWGGGVVHDGSLDCTGFEITTAPAGGDLFVDQIDEICKYLNMSNAVVNNSCGLHVHIDARDFGWWEVRRLIMLYAKIENALFECVPAKRRRSTYCLRCGPEYMNRITNGFKPKECKKKIAEAVYHTSDTRDMRQQKYNNARYQALNLHSWFHRGTVECRLFGGTTNATKIKNWGIFWASLLDWVYTHKDKDVETLTGNPWETLLAVTPTDEIRKWLTERKEKFAKTIGDAGTTLLHTEEE